jgi:hypothetical protein
MDAIQRLRGDLGAAGVIEEYRRAVQRRELTSDCGKVEGHVEFSFYSDSP